MGTSSRLGRPDLQGNTEMTMSHWGNLYGPTAIVLAALANVACQPTLVDSRNDRGALVASASEPDLEKAVAAVKRLSELFQDDGLDEVLQTSQVRGRELAALELRAHRTARSRNALVRALADPAPTVRANAADSLGVVGDQSSVASLEKVSSSDPDQFARSMAKQALAKLMR